MKQILVPILLFCLVASPAFATPQPFSIESLLRLAVFTKEVFLKQGEPVQNNKEMEIIIGNFFIGLNRSDLLTDFGECASYLGLTVEDYLLSKADFKKHEVYEGILDLSLSLGNFSLTARSCVDGSEGMHNAFESYVNQFATPTDFFLNTESNLIKNYKQVISLFDQLRISLKRKDFEKASYYLGRLFLVLFSCNKSTEEATLMVDSNIIHVLNHAFNLTYEFLSHTGFVNDSANMLTCEQHIDTFFSTVEKGLELIKSKKTRVEGVLTVFDSFQEFYPIVTNCGTVGSELDEGIKSYSDVLHDPKLMLQNLISNGADVARDVFALYSCVQKGDSKCIADNLGTLLYYALNPQKK